MREQASLRGHGKDHVLGVTPGADGGAATAKLLDTRYERLVCRFVGIIGAVCVKRADSGVVFVMALGDRICWRRSGAWNTGARSLPFSNPVGPGFVPPIRLAIFPVVADLLAFYGGQDRAIQVAIGDYQVRTRVARLEDAELAGQIVGTREVGVMRIGEDRSREFGSASNGNRGDDQGGANEAAQDGLHWNCETTERVSGMLQSP
jgi:hypothetical protein